MTGVSGEAGSLSDVPMSPVFVTGATGFVGGPILRQLAGTARPVTALARNRTRGDIVAAAGARPVIGSVLDPAVLDAGMRGCDVVYHVAGVNQLCGRDSSEMFRVNVEGTRHVIRAAGRAGVRRVVYTSSAATIGEGQGTVGTEASPHRGTFLSEYERSKYEAERVAFSEAERNGIELVAVNPSSVQGTGRIGGSARLLRYAIESRAPVMVDTVVSVVDIDDCTRGHLRAEVAGIAGERYILNGATIRAFDLVRLLADITGRSVVPVPLPRVMASRLGAVVAAVAGRRDDAVFCREMLRTLLHGHRYDGSRAQRELGFRYTPLRETLVRTIRWFVDVGVVRTSLPNFPTLER